MSIKKRLLGFTIVELLIVIVVIGILAAITIVAYNGIQNRARASAASSALSQAAKKIVVWQVDNPGSVPPNLSEAGVMNSDGVSYQYSQINTGTGYCITATVGNTSYYLNSTTQTTPASGGCSGHGQGGQSAITNVVENPNLDTNMSGWGSRGTGVAVTRSTSTYRSSGASLAIQMGASIQTDWGAAASSNITVAAGQVYNFSAYLRAPSSANMSINVYWRRSDGTAIRLDTGSVVTGSSSLLRSELVMAAPSTAASASIILNSYTPSALFYADDIMMYAGSGSSGYADGNSPDWIWNGTPNNSTSTGPSL